MRLAAPSPRNGVAYARRASLAKAYKAGGMKTRGKPVVVAWVRETSVALPGAHKPKDAEITREDRRSIKRENRRGGAFDGAIKRKIDAAVPRRRG